MRAWQERGRCWQPSAVLMVCIGIRGLLGSRQRRGLPPIDPSSEILSEEGFPRGIKEEHAVYFFSEFIQMCDPFQLFQSTVNLLDFA
jgi:hypothetical protein